MNIIREISSALHLMIAAIRLRDKKTEIHTTATGQCVASLSTARLVSFLLVQSVRISIATFLGWGGMRFLSYTINLPEMLLNSVALEFVLERSPAGKSASPAPRAPTSVHPWTFEHFLIFIHAKPRSGLLG